MLDHQYGKFLAVSLMNLVIFILFFKRTIQKNIFAVILIFMHIFSISYATLAFQRFFKFSSTARETNVDFHVFIIMLITGSIPIIAFLRMNRELMKAIEFNMAHKVHFETIFQSLSESVATTHKGKLDLSNKQFYDTFRTHIPKVISAPLPEGSQEGKSMLNQIC